MAGPLVLLAAACTVALPHAASVRAHAAAAPPALRGGRCAAAARTTPPLAGVTATAASLGQFTAASGIRPGIAEYYTRFGRDPFGPAAACALETAGALPLIDWNPRGVPLAGIVSGRYDAYLRGYAAAVREFGAPVALSFGHEMNGSWETWGYRHASPRLFIAAWRHIHGLLAAARNVIWVWGVNRTGPGISAPRLWWPGAQYVTWAGLDSYYARGEYTFAGVVGATLRVIRRFTSVPVLIAETGVAAGPGRPSRIADLFTGMENTPGLAGVVWYDENASHGRWRLEGSPASLAAFAAGASAYLAGGR